MTRIHYTMPARSQGKLYTQRQQARLEYYDVHRWVFVYNMDPDVETLVRKWLTTRLDNFYCDLQVMYTPPLHAMSRTDDVDVDGLTARDAVKALIKATGLNPRSPCAGGRSAWTTWTA